MGRTKKKLKFSFYNIDCQVSSIEDIKPLTDLLQKAAIYERELKHLAVSAGYYNLHDDIARQIKEQL